MRFLLLGLLMLLGCEGVSAQQQTEVSRPQITGISHVTFYADDLAKSQEFYTRIVGWEQAPAGPAVSGMRFYANHAQSIELVSPPTKGLADRLAGIGFATNDAEAMRAYLAARGISVPNAVEQDRDGNRSFGVHDPEGHAIEFTQQGPRPPQAEKSANPVSLHINHAGFVVRDRGAEDRLYHDLLGFRLYWEGGSGPGHTDWVMMQVPDGTDWLEYMLYLPAAPSPAQLGGANHFSPGVVSMAELEQKLTHNGWHPAEGEKPLLGVDAKWQLDLHDPDGTRVEFMEFLPVKEPCCSAYTGKQPSIAQAW